MKKRKSMIMLSIIVAVLVLGIGYAAVNGVTLSISGTAATESHNLAVSFNGVTSVGTLPTGVTATAAATDGSLTGTISVAGLSAVGQTVSATYTIKNEEADLDAEVLMDTVSNDKTDFFEVTTDVDSDPVTVPAGRTATVTVTVELIKLPIESSDSTANITVNFSADPVQP